MSKKSKNKSKKGGFLSHFIRKSLLVLACIIPVALAICYFRQPDASRKETKRLICSWGRHIDKISILELAADLASLYDANAPFVNITEEAKSPIGGVIRADRRLLLLQNEAFYIGYDEEMRLPAWVAYRLFDCGEAHAGERPEAFLPDRRLKKPVTSEDYTGTGYDRGHLAPNSAIGRCYGRSAQLETFILSNIVPQKHHFNAGIWKKLEAREINNYSLRYGEIWVIAGPIFGRQLRFTESGLPIPEKLFKIIACHRGGKLYALSFIMDQNAEGKFSTYICSIDEIEEQSGLDIFPQLTQEQQQILESHKAKKVW